MFKKYSTLILIVMVFNPFIYAQTQDSRLVLNTKNTVAKVGTEPNRKIKVTLKDGTKLKGYITEIKDDYFALLDTKSGKVTQIQYSQVIEAKRDGLSRFAISLITSGAILGGLFTVIAIGLANDR